MAHPWFDSKILNLCKMKALLHKKYKASETPAIYDRFSVSANCNIINLNFNQEI